jgi:tRNA G46 methylase TrmB
LVLGLEIRDKVVDIVKDRVTKLRKEATAAREAAAAGTVAAPTGAYLTTHSASPSPAPWCPNAPSFALGSTPFTYENISCVKTNFMKYAPNYFRPAQLEKIFFLFADPHFKKSNFRRRVINTNFLAIYAHILQVGGMLYTITDVLDLHNWQVEHLDAHPLFERIPDADLVNDPCFSAMHMATEEGQKVTRLSGQKYPAVYRRIAAKQPQQ